MAGTGTETELFVPCKRVKAVLGPKEFLLLERGANIMAPSAKSVDGDKGRRLLLDGPRDAQAAALVTVLLRLTPAERHTSISDSTAKCWHYKSPAGTREGPFAARALLSWLSKGQLQPGFLVQHGPSRVWMPLSLLSRHYELLPRALEGAYGPIPWPIPLIADGDVVMTDAELAAEIAQLRQQRDFLEAIAEVASMDVDATGIVSNDAVTQGSLARAAAAALLSAAEPLLHLPTPMDVDIEPQLDAAEQLQQLQPMDLSLGLSAVATRPTRLYLVIDTNVLLLHDGVRLLQRVRQCFAPRSSRGTGDGSAPPAPGGDGGSGDAGGGGGSGDGCSDGRRDSFLSCVAVVPWTVLAELDGLKADRGGAAAARGKHKHIDNGGVNDDGEYDSDEEGRPVAVMARAAVSLLLSAMDSGDTFFRGQTLKQFRAASCHPTAAIPLGAARISNDDRILQCALHLQDELSAKAAATGRAYQVALLSNDNALCVKARVCGIPASSIRQLLANAGASSSEIAVPDQHGPTNSTSLQPEQLEAALLRLSHRQQQQQQQQPATAGLTPSKAAAAAEPSALAPMSASSSPPVAPATYSSSTEGPSAPGSGGPVSDSSGPFVVHTYDEYGAPQSAASGPSGVAGSAAAWSDSSGGTGASGSNGGAGGGKSGSASGGRGPPSGAAAASLPSGGDLVGEFDLDEASDPLVSALHAELRRLTVALAPVLRDILVSEYEELWTGVVVRSPPWGGADVLELLQRHLDSVFSGRMGRGAARELRPLLDTMLKDVRYFERGRGRPRREARFLNVAEDFSRGVSDILETFGVAPPPPPALPAALLQLRGGGAPATAAGPHLNTSTSGGLGHGGGFTARPAAAQAAAPGHLWAEGREARAAAAAPGGGLHQRSGGDASGEAPALSPAAMRAAAIAQSIGLAVNLSGVRARGSSGAPSPGGAVSPAAAAAGVVGAPAAKPGGRGPGGTGAEHRHHGIAVGANPAATGAAEAAAAAGAGTIHEKDAAAATMAAVTAELQAKLLAAGTPAGAVDAQLAQLLQQLMLAQQVQAQQHQQRQRHEQSGARGGSAGGMQVMRALSDNGQGASAAHIQQQAMMQHQLQHQHQQHQQQQQHRQLLLQRFHSDPAPDAEAAGGGAAAASAGFVSMAAAAAAGPGAASQAEAAARQLQWLQIQQQLQQQQQHHEKEQKERQLHQQQQAQQAQHAQQAAFQMLARRASVEAEALQAQAQAQAQAQHLSRAPSGGTSALSPTGSLLGAGSGPSAAWQALLSETHQRQQLQQRLAQQQQMLILQQAAAAAGGGGAAGDVAGAISAVEGGAGAAVGGSPAPEVLALLQQAMIAEHHHQQQQHHHHHQLQQRQALQQHHHQQQQLLQQLAAAAAVAGHGLVDDPQSANGAGGASALSLHAAIAAAAAAGAGCGPQGGLVPVDLGGGRSVERRLSELSGSSMATD